MNLPAFESSALQKYYTSVISANQDKIHKQPQVYSTNVWSKGVSRSNVT